MGIMDGVRDARPAAATGAGAPPLRLADDWERLAYLREVCELLWPPTAEMTLYGGAQGWPQISGGVRPRALGGAARGAVGTSSRGWRTPGIKTKSRPSDRAAPPSALGRTPPLICGQPWASP